MKKMSFTNVELKGWLSKLGLSSFLILFALCFAGLGSLDAQITHPVGLKGKTLKYKIETCKDANVQYTDDNSVDGKLYSNYRTDKDGKFTALPRTDTVEICPQDRWHHVTVTFTEFDIAANDELQVYDGSYDSLTTKVLTNKPAQVSGSPLKGTGVSSANGGWVAASCSPDVNPTGCLTFVFNTTDNNGQVNTKGTGWDAWVSCADRGIKIGKASGNKFNVASKKIECSGPATATITIPKPSLESTCSPFTTAGMTLVVKRANGEKCTGFKATYTATEFAALPATGVDVGMYAVGLYTAEWYVTSDSKKTTGVHTFSVSLPALVCNDNVNIPFGSACAVEIAPDDVLENPCVPLPTYLTYNVTVKIGSGAGAIITGSGSGAASGSLRAWPIITKELIEEVAKKSGKDADFCKGSAEVTIERVYTPPATAACQNGVQKTSCTTTVNFRDDTAPVASIELTDKKGNAITELIACDEESLRKLIKIGAVDNCDIRDTTISIRLEETDPCFNSGGKFGADTTRAIVTVTAVDFCDNKSTITDTFTILRPKSFVIGKNKTFECDKSGEATPLPGLEVGYVIGMDTTITDTLYKLSTEEYYCGYILRAARQPVPGTDCGEKEFITWNYLDWCRPSDGVKPIGTQFIEYLDRTPPLVLDTLDKRVELKIDGDKTKFKVLAPSTRYLGHFSCKYDLTKDETPRAYDNCDDNPTVSLARIFRIEDGKTDWEVTSFTDLDCDSFYVEWRAADICHEQQKTDVAYQIIVIEDNTKPSAVATDQLNISLPNEWGARICVDDIDAGSFDACGIKSRGIRIKGKGGAFVKCIDIGCEYVHPDLQIELQIEDNKGNVNTAWTDILVEDKIAPICDDLDDVEKYCDEFHNGELGASTDTDGDRKFEDSEWVVLSSDLQDLYNKHFGTFYCVDNLKGESCGQLTRVEEYQLIEWPCGEIEIRRRVRATDWSELTSEPATQNVKIVYRAGWKFTVPNDWTGECDDQAIAPELVIDNGACDLLGYEVTSKLYEVPGDACWKMERTYHIINWCKYSAGEEPVVLARREGEHGHAEGFMITSEGNEDSGYFTYVQVLKVHDNEGPVVTVVDPEPCISGIEYDALPYGEEDITPGSAPYECDEPKTWTASATDCSDQSVITWEGKLFDANGNVVATSKTNSITYVVTNKSTYTAEFWAYDGCGNSGGKKGEAIKFWDCKKPTPYAINGIAVELMQTGMISVWATDVDQGSFDNCTDQSKLDLRIWHATLGDAPTTLAGVEALPKVIDLTCTELGTQNVHLYVTDEEGNYDFVQTYVIVQDNMGACNNVEPGNGGMVAGRIVDGNGENVQSVSIAINGADSRNMTTSADGHYQFVLPMGGDYTVTPQKDMNPLNGVSTFDLVLISKHILGISTFDTPYKYIAADVNKSGSITAFDMVQLRQLILNITSEFPNNDSWRFVEGGYEFTSANPAAESFNEFVSINNLASNMEHMDFTAIKVGDVNGNALANSLLGAESRTTNGTLNLNVADRFVEAGQAVTVEFTSADIANATGYQFTLNVAGAANVVEGVAKAANFNTNLAGRGVVATSWNGEATATDVLFAITFTPNTTGLLSEMVAVSSDVVAAEAYNTDGEMMNVNIDFSAATAAGFELNQNTPNPFAAETTIGFNLPTAGSATLKVMDVQGKVLKAITADYAKGYNQVSLNANELGATGVLYYQLESADNVATKKMIIIE